VSTAVNAATIGELVSFYHATEPGLFPNSSPTAAASYSAYLGWVEQ
jgi:hypothetical protein